VPTGRGATQASGKLLMPLQFRVPIVVHAGLGIRLSKRSTPTLQAPNALMPTLRGVGFVKAST